MEKDNYITIGTNQQHYIVEVNYDGSHPFQDLTYFTFKNDKKNNFFYGWEDFAIKQYCYKEEKGILSIYPQIDIVQFLKTQDVYKEQIRLYNEQAFSIEELQASIVEIMFMQDIEEFE